MPSDDELARTATAAGTSEQASKLGDTLGRYRIERTLGEGGMGVVHAAFDPDLERRVALKVLRGAESDEARQRLLREARAMARLTHANVVTVHEVGSASGRDYVALELVVGETLAEWLRAQPRTPDEIVAAFVAAGRGLAAAHHAGLVHRDFKPHNVLRRRDGRVCVTDFGLARGVDATGLETTTNLKSSSNSVSTPSSLSGLTATGSVLGTPAYMAPEQWTGGTIGPAADQFAFCVALWEALTGERPFRGATLDDLKRDVARGPAELDASRLPWRLRGALRRGLDADPSRRWPNMDALLAAISPRRRSRLPLVLAGCVVVAAAALYVALGRGGGALGCPPPARDPAPLLAASFGRADVAQVFARDVARWRELRGQACSEAPDRRADKLACLDGVIARAAAVQLATARAGANGSPDEALSWLIDPDACAGATPPRLTLAPSEDTQAALALMLAAKSQHHKPDEASVRALATRSGLDSCSRTIALAALDAISDASVGHKAATDEITAADACGDDWLRAYALIAEAPYEYEQPSIGPKGRAAVERAKVAVDRVPDRGLVATIDQMRAQIAGQDKHFAEAFATVEHAVETFGARGQRREQIAAVETANGLRFQRTEVADLEAMRASIAKWKPVAAELHDDHLVRALGMTDAYARLFLGDLAGAHPELVRLWEPDHHPDMPSQKVAGTVVDAAGKPVAGATVAVGILMWVDSMGVLPFGDTTGLRMTTSDADGRFEIADAPMTGAIFAQQGDRRVAQALAPNARLVLQPTRKLAGKVNLGTTLRTKTFVMIASEATRSLMMMAPLEADGTFAYDGAPTSELSVGVATWALERSGNVAFTKVPPSHEAALGLVLDAPNTDRVLEVIARSELPTALDAAQVFLMPGRHQVKTVDELNKQSHGQAVGQMRFAKAIVGEDIPAAVRGKTRPGDLIAHFTDVPSGEVTVCVVGINGDVNDSAMWRKLTAHARELQLRCATARADETSLIVEVPPQKRFD